MWPYRPGELRTTPGPVPGVVVLTGGRRFFFPGGTAELALILAKPVLGDALTDPGTGIEFGEADGKLWTTLKVIKAPPAKPRLPEEGWSATLIER